MNEEPQKRECPTGAPGAQFELSALETADRIDRAFFATDSDEITRRRALRRGEVPLSLSKRHIREVKISRIAPGILLRAFIDSYGNPVALAPLFDPELFFTAEGRQQAPCFVSNR
jgi:hypothetical protein